MSWIGGTAGAALYAAQRYLEEQKRQDEQTMKVSDLLDLAQAREADGEGDFEVRVLESIDGSCRLIFLDPSDRSGDASHDREASFAIRA